MPPPPPRWVAPAPAVEAGHLQGEHNRTANAVEVRVPNIGDFDSVEVIELLVKVGDAVSVEQSLITVESDKASMEIPSGSSGTISELKVRVGDKVSEGSVIAVLIPDKDQARVKTVPKVELNDKPAPTYVEKEKFRPPIFKLILWAPLVAVIVFSACQFIIYTINKAAPVAQTKADPAAGQKVVEQWGCSACHGADGNSTDPDFPKLAGQHADYLAKQLSNFRAQAPATVAERENLLMYAFAVTLSDADMRNVASWFESQKQKPAIARDKALADAGQQIYLRGIPEKNVPACAGCHAPNGAGIRAQSPRLQGQWAEYTEAQLIKMRQGGERRNSAQMTTIASRLTDREAKAVAEYVAGLR